MSDLLSQTDRALLELQELWEAGNQAGFSFTEVLGARGLKFFFGTGVDRKFIRERNEYNALTLHDLTRFDTNGLIEISWSTTVNGRRGDATFTARGLRHVQQLRSQGSENVVRPASTWQNDVLPVLKTVRVLEEQMPPGNLVSRQAVDAAMERSPDDAETTRALMRLNDGGYLADALENDASPAPFMFRLATKGLQATAGWPGPATSEHVSAVLDDMIERPGTSEEDRESLSSVKRALQEIDPHLLEALASSLNGREDA